MSYPNYGAGQGYPPYMGQPQPNQQPGYPGGGGFMGYDNSASMPSYGASPAGPGVIGFNIGMPPIQNAYPNMQTGGGYPAMGGYPPQQPGGYPPQQPGGYPPQQPGGYPGQQPGGYPPQQPGGYPGQQPGGYQPQQPGGYPGQQPGGYPGQQPQQPGGYPGQQPGGYPPQQQQQPQQQPGGYPPQQPQQQAAYPPQQQGGAYPQPISASHSPVPQHKAYPTQQKPVSSAPPPQQGSYPSPGQQTKHVKEEGTLKPYPGFNAEADAQMLRKAMKGFGTDEKAIIDVLGSRSNAQRQDIVKMFKTIFGKDLIKELKGELSGKFEDVILGLLYTPTMYDAVELKRSMQGMGTDEAVLIEILCSRTNREILEISDCFKKITGKSLEQWLKSETSGHFGRLLVSLSTGGRSESQNVDHQRAEQDAKRLYEAGENQWGTDESQFNAIFNIQSPAQLKAVFEAYKRLYNRDMTQVIANEMSGDIKNGMLSIVKVVQNKPGYFAECLYSSMAGAGTDDSALIRLVISRCEVDMKQIKEQFQIMYGKTLDGMIESDCSGDYRRILLRLVGN